MKSVLVKILKGLLSFIKYEDGRAITELGWKGIFRNLMAMAKLSLDGKSKTNYKNSLAIVFDRVKEGWSFQGTLDLVKDHWVPLPIKRLIAESAVLVTTVSGLIGGWCLARGR